MPMPPAGSLTLDADLTARLHRLADARQRPSDGLIRDAVRQYLDREERRETFVRDGQAAWAAFQADGLHMTAEEADIWLARLEADEPAEPPSCHG